MPFDTTYSQLPPRFYQSIRPTPVKNPQLIIVNESLNHELNISEFSKLDSSEWANVISGNVLLKTSTPIAQAYAGHQFGHFVPKLGDGRAILLGEVVDRNGERRDIQLKGCGQTAFSRQGDGRAPLGSIIREYILSESMHALGVPTTRALACIKTGEMVQRETTVPGGIIARVAKSHIRIGTFEYFAARQDHEGIKTLIDYSIHRHYSHLSDAEIPALALLEEVIDVQAALVAKWMQLGFIHGVMNTDNTTISGQTIDYGPCAFMEAYDPNTVFSSIDYHGRYAYGNQPQIMQWNLTRLAQCLVPLIDANQEKAIRLAQEALGVYQDKYDTYYWNGFAQKIGVQKAHETDKSLLKELFRIMTDAKADFTQTFYNLSNAIKETTNTADLNKLCSIQPGFLDWIKQWRARCAQGAYSVAEISELMHQVNPCVIPRNHRVQAVISAIYDNDEYREFHQCLNLLNTPYDCPVQYPEYMNPASPDEAVYQTFCGT